MDNEGCVKFLEKVIRSKGWREEGNGGEDKDWRRENEFYKKKTSMKTRERVPLISEVRVEDQKKNNRVSTGL